MVLVRPGRSPQWVCSSALLNDIRICPGWQSYPSSKNIIRRHKHALIAANGRLISHASRPEEKLREVVPAELSGKNLRLRRLPPHRPFAPRILLHGHSHATLLYVR
jgi:hypothetical protein